MRIFKRFPYISYALVITALGLIAASTQKVADAVSDLIGDSGWCGNYISGCQLYFWVIVILGILGLGIFLEIVARGKKSPKENLTRNVDSVSVIPYNGLKIEEDGGNLNIGDYASLGAGLVNEIKLRVLASNTDMSIYDCQVVLDNFEFHGLDQNAQWEDSYRGFDRKAMKWDVGYMPTEGKIELERNSRKPLEIAKSTKGTSMQLSYLDGYSTRRYSLNGMYRATLVIYANVLVNNIKKPIKELKYRLTFTYENDMLYRKTEIEKFEE